MNWNKIEKVEQEMKRLGDAIEDLRDAIYGPSVLLVARSKYSGTVRRRSMDLTRALVDLRKPD